MLFDPQMEAECNAVATGRKRKEEIMQPILAKMLECFERANAEVRKLDNAVARHFTKLGSNDANSNTLIANFSKCGGCQGMTTLKELNNGGGQGNRRNNRNNNNTRSKTKLLHCSTCSIGLRLPKGVPSASTNDQTNNQPMFCPICDYQVIKISQGDGYNGNGYQLCPKCFTDAPREYGGSATSGEFRCFNCTHPTCSLATGTRGGDIEIFTCPFCNSSGANGKITLRKNSRGYTLSCSNYIATATNRTRCDFTIWLPREASSITIPESNSNNNNNNNNGPVICNRCSNENKIVRKLLFRWKPNSVPPGVAREHLACVLCDEVLKSDFRVSVPQLNQVRIRGRQNTSSNRNIRGNRGTGGARNSNRSRERVFNNPGRGRGNNRQIRNNGGRGGVSTTNDIRCFKCGQLGHYSNACTN
jgi:hypothetical protein